MKRKLLYLGLFVAFVFGATTTFNGKKEVLEYSKVNNAVFAQTQQEIISSASNLVEHAIRNISFGEFNIAYAEIMRINDLSVRDGLLVRLSTISEAVWSDDIKAYVALLEDLTNTGSGRIYEKIITEINSTSLSDFDKGYLLGELTGWGRKLVYTQDYTNAVDKLVYAWDRLSNGTDENLTAAISAAQSGINGVKNSYSKAYLIEELNKIKVQAEFSIVEIN